MARVTASITRPADNTAYQSGDAIANSASAAAVVPLTFTLAGTKQAKILGASCVVTPASSNLVITALDFDLLIFRPATDIPFAAGSFAADNAAMAISAAAFRELVGVFSFVNGAWRNPAGALTAGVTGYQAVAATPRTFGYHFDPVNDSSTLIGVIQAKAAWTPLGVANQFDFALDISY